MGGLIDTGKHTRNGGNPTKGRAGDIAKRTGRKDSPRAKFDLGRNEEHDLDDCFNNHMIGVACSA